MQAGAADLADGVQAGDVGAAVLVHHHAAAGVVRGRHHRNGLAGQVEAQFPTTAGDGGKALLNEALGPVADVEMHMVQPQPLHFVVDGAGHDVPGRQFRSGVELRHEAAAVVQGQHAALAAHRLGNQEGLGLRMVQAGGMELNELHVGDAAAGPPSHGDAVPGGAVWVAGVEIDFAGPAGGENHEAGLENLHMAAAAVQHISAGAAVAVAPQLAQVDEVDGDAVIEKLYPGMVQRFLGQLGDHRLAGGVRHMQDAAKGVASLLGEVEFVANAVKGNAEAA